MRCLLTMVGLLLLLDGSAADSIGNQIRRIPPPGIRITTEDRDELEAGSRALGEEIETLHRGLHGKPALLELLPDVEIFHKAVDWALRHDEFYRSNDVQIARGVLKQGRERAAFLREGKAPWTSATSLIVRGYVSKIDGSVQPYGVVVPASFGPSRTERHRLDIWLHGRADHLTELKFISDRQRSFGEFAPTNAFVLHPYGRYCNAFKFAGEVDVFEALDHVRKHYPIDENRVALRGFSMGGAGCWHLAAHYADRWVVAAPGAGFANTADYLKTPRGENGPPWYAQKLWHLYDATDYALNLFNTTVVAYSGELDKQKAAADAMAKAMKLEGLDLVHLIGPKTGHRYEPETKKELAKRVDDLVVQGRESVRGRVRLTTHTLKYNQADWVTIDGLEKHWEQARVDAEIGNSRTWRVSASNVSEFTLSPPRSLSATGYSWTPTVILENDVFLVKERSTDGMSWIARLRKKDGKWKLLSSHDPEGLKKKHNLQGPIDDAFMDSFTFVRPTGEAWNPAVGKWIGNELEKAAIEWRNQFRGDVRIRADSEITDGDIAANNLILWGDPQSNKLLGRIADKLPISWDAKAVRVGKKSFPSTNHLPVLIYPNPLNPKRYVVLNSGFTFAHPVSNSNADQTPKLPDYAVVDIDGPPSVGVAGKVVEAGFFDERWNLPTATTQQ